MAGKRIMYLMLLHPFCGQVYSFNSLLHPEMSFESKKESFFAIILEKVNKN